MKAVVVTEPGRLEIVERPMPRIEASTQALLRVRFGGLCGSDLHAFHGRSPFVRYPIVIGHELSAVVEEVGAGVTRVKPGDHVVFDPVNRCGACEPCLSGRGNVCEKLQVNGAHVDGGFAQYIVAEESKLHPISKEVPLDIAVMAEPFTIGAQATSRGRLREGDRVLVVGAGPIGQVMVQVCKAAGATVTISDLSAERLTMAKRNGADHILQAQPGGIGLSEFMEKEGIPPFTLAIDAVGAPAILPEVLGHMAQAGRVVLLGFSAQESPIHQLDITKRELDVVGSRLSIGQFPKVVQWLEQGRVHPEKIITHRLPFEQAQKGLELMQDNPGECSKVLLVF